MKCHLCINYIEMQTDPATCDYLIVSGARRKEERWDMAENEQILTTGNVFLCLFGQHGTHPTFRMSLNVLSKSCFLFFFILLINSLHVCIPERTEKEKLETDAMFKLDHEGKDKEKLKKALPSLTDIIDYQSRWKDDYQLNSSLRRKFRVKDSYFLCWLLSSCQGNILIENLHTHPIQSTKSGVSEVTSLFVALEFFPFICNIQTPSDFNSLIPQLHFSLKSFVWCEL